MKEYNGPLLPAVNDINKNKGINKYKYLLYLFLLLKRIINTAIIIHLPKTIGPPPIAVILPPSNEEIWSNSDNPNNNKNVETPTKIQRNLFISCLFNASIAI